MLKYQQLVQSFSFQLENATHTTKQMILKVEAEVIAALFNDTEDLIEAIHLISAILKTSRHS